MVVKYVIGFVSEQISLCLSSNNTLTTVNREIFAALTL
jgi:hypothetical protein